ncbi:MAG: hypothetical protein IID30_05765, partial [Planctomycetes bacterium]|nr:hypothetical protein [Planctomycetota bacterium]
MNKLTFAVVTSLGLLASDAMGQSLSDRIKHFRNSQIQAQANNQSKSHILSTLVYTDISVKFQDAPARDAFNYIQTILNINIIGRYSDDRTGIGIDPELLINLDVVDTPALTVLELMLAQTEEDLEGSTWQLREGFLEIGTKERLGSGSAREIRYYPISDLLFEVPHFNNAPELDLASALAQGRSGGGGGGRANALDQNLTLNISGKLSATTSLSFRLNDQDLPLSADGRSAELRELDEISVVLSSPMVNIALGDYDFSLKGYEFATIERKLDGASARINKGALTIGASAALSGGTFHSVRFSGTEGRQGPYQLKGKNNEPVRILAGTERIYLDGRKLKRGLRNDYVIDYNLGTILFTDQQIIRSDSRIEADYEYSSSSFRKAPYSLTSAWRGQRASLRGYFLRESDLAGNPLAGQFTPEERQYLEQSGAGLDSLLNTGVRYVGAGNGSYSLTRSTPDKPIFTYLGRGNGDYEVTFSNLGPGGGSYVFDSASGSYSYLGPGLGAYEP